MSNSSQIRFSSGINEVRNMGTDSLRSNFLVSNLFQSNHIEIVYSLQDRFILGGVMPTSSIIVLPSFEEITKADFFLERRELGVINVGGNGIIEVDGTQYKLSKKDALYIGRGNKNISFKSENESEPAMFYLNSVLAHTSYPNVFIPIKEVIPAEMGEFETANRRNIYKIIVKERLPTCQLVMGLTDLLSPSTWNTFPPHTHIRRNEVYFYFDIPKDQILIHLMGEPDHTRHLICHNHEAVISPEWSIHSGVGTAAYSFIWGMGGENLEYSDMDKVNPLDLK
jgi:4-deoxy-L-threo-5-hexosulose-uronate ketol-isomerase